MKLFRRRNQEAKRSTSAAAQERLRALAEQKARETLDTTGWRVVTRKEISPRDWSIADTTAERVVAEEAAQHLHKDNLFPLWCVLYKFPAAHTVHWPRAEYMTDYDPYEYDEDLPADHPDLCTQERIHKSDTGSVWTLCSAHLPCIEDIGSYDFTLDLSDAGVTDAVHVTLTVHRLCWVLRLRTLRVTITDGACELCAVPAGAYFLFVPEDTGEKPELDPALTIPPLIVKALEHAFPQLSSDGYTGHVERVSALTSPPQINLRELARMTWDTLVVPPAVLHDEGSTDVTPDVRRIATRLRAKIDEEIQGLDPADARDVLTACGLTSVRSIIVGRTSVDSWYSTPLDALRTPLSSLLDTFSEEYSDVDTSTLLDDAEDGLLALLVEFPKLRYIGVCDDDGELQPLWVRSHREYEGSAWTLETGYYDTPAYSFMGGRGLSHAVQYDNFQYQLQVSTIILPKTGAAGRLTEALMTYAIGRRRVDPGLYEAERTSNETVVERSAHCRGRHYLSSGVGELFREALPDGSEIVGRAVDRDRETMVLDLAADTVPVHPPISIPLTEWSKLRESALSNLLTDIRRKNSFLSLVLDFIKVEHPPAGPSGESVAVIVEPHPEFEPIPETVSVGDIVYCEYVSPAYGRVASLVTVSHVDGEMLTLSFKDGIAAIPGTAIFLELCRPGEDRFPASARTIYRALDTQNPHKFEK